MLAKKPCWKRLGKRLGIDQVKVEYILFAHINKLILGELVAYVDNLHIPLEVKISSHIDKRNGLAYLLIFFLDDDNPELIGVINK